MNILSSLTLICSNFDSSLLCFFHGLAAYFGYFLTPIMKLISFLGENGIFVFIVGAVMLLFKKTRKAGAAIILCVLLTGICNTLILKNIFARPRPFADAGGVYYSFWQFVGAPDETGYSFPSGHTVVAMAAAVSIFLSFNKRYSFVAFAFPLLMGISRCYLTVHYPSDVLASILVGAVLGAAAFFIADLVFKKTSLKIYNADKKEQLT